MDLLIETSSSLRRFVSDLVIKTKQAIILKQGGVLGHPKFTLANKKTGLTLIDTGNMLASITCQVNQVSDGLHIMATSNAEYSSYVQISKNGIKKNWDIMKFTAEELNYYAKEIQNNITGTFR